ncbi:hypothetical protein MUO14_23640 [Halobacillus shinanisalinarum]|uniref:Stage II sporulation protein M n=1 Tax=Halobacillus shinanisalinarum TaxID=2932258 RepID=A0ABY4GZH9_9BACI|nr:hypothetical protein [Halobacillus shinanisalinarum]UOQ93330.1 hypothetical protein MUO14_23640 [Halobacillus shinanisalinarum]
MENNKLSGYLRLLAYLLGFIGSVIGIYICWTKHLIVTGGPIEITPSSKDLISSQIRTLYFFIERINVTILLFIPACIGILGTILKNPIFLYMAFLMSIPVDGVISVKASSMLSVQYPMFLYLFSALLFTFIKKLPRNPARTSPSLRN